MKEAIAGSPRPFGLPNLAPDGVGGSGGNGDKPFTLLPGATPLGEKIVKQRRQAGARRQAEQPKPTLGEEINAYLDERARLRAQGLLPNSFDETPILTPADAIALDLFAYDLEQFDSQPDEHAKGRSISRILWGFDASAFGLMSQDVREHITVRYEMMLGFHRTRPYIFEGLSTLNGEETAILAEQLAKVGVPFKPPRQGITIPFRQTVKKMREVASGLPVWETPPPNVTHIKDHPRRNH